MTPTQFLEVSTRPLLSPLNLGTRFLLGGRIVTPRPDTPAVGPETPDKAVEASLNPSLSLSTLTQPSLLSLFFFPELGSFPHCPTIDLHLRLPDRRFLL